MSNKPCAQTTLVTDNTPLECDEFISTACVTHPDALIELGLPENSTAQTIFNALLNAIINLNNQIGNTGDVTGMEIQDDGSIVINEAFKINFTDNLTAVVDGTDADKVNVSATLPNYTIAIDSSNMLSILQDSVIVSTVDLTPYLDNTNLPQTISAAIVGTDMVFTRDDASTYLVDISGLINATASPIVVSGEIVGTDIVLTKDDASTVTIDASPLFDDTNLPRIVSAEVVGTELVFTRDDASMFMADVSSLLDNVNLSRIVSGVMSSTDLILTRDDASTIVLDLSSLFQNAMQVPFTPTTTLTESNVQAVLEQLDDIKINSVVAGTNVTVDNTDPQNPIINVASGGTTEGIDDTLAVGQILTANRTIDASTFNYLVQGNNGSNLSNLISLSGFGTSLRTDDSNDSSQAAFNTASNAATMTFSQLTNSSSVLVDELGVLLRSNQGGYRLGVPALDSSTVVPDTPAVVVQSLVYDPLTGFVYKQPISSGGGATNLTFNAATSEVESDTGTNATIPSADSTNKGLLDFYEEGTFTVTLIDTSGGATYNTSVNQCSYVRINNMVTLHIRLEGVTVSGTAGVAGFQISGLPASIASVAGSSFPLLNAEISGSNIQHTYVVGRVVNTNITFIRRTSSTTAQNPTFLAPSSFINGRVYVTGSYPIV